MPRKDHVPQCLESSCSHFCLLSLGAWLPYSKLKLLLKSYSSYGSYAELRISYAELVVLGQFRIFFFFEEFLNAPAQPFERYIVTFSLGFWRFLNGSPGEMLSVIQDLELRPFFRISLPRAVERLLQEIFSAPLCKWKAWLVLCGSFIIPSWHAPWCKVFDYFTLRKVESLMLNCYTTKITTKELVAFSFNCDPEYFCR